MMTNVNEDSRNLAESIPHWLHARNIADVRFKNENHQFWGLLQKEIRLNSHAKEIRTFHAQTTSILFVWQNLIYKDTTAFGERYNLTI